MPSSAPQPPPLVAARDLALARGGRQLFAGLALAVRPGELLALRGPNGAGKSSLLRALAGILTPAAGTVERPAALHLLAHAAGVTARLTLAENLAFWRTLNGPGGLAPEAALDSVGLGGLGGIAAGHLSAGQTRRLALARLIVSDRPLWLLDEPLAALDAAGAALVARLVAERLRRGGAVVAATHDDLPVPAGTAAATLWLGGAP